MGGITCHMQDNYNICISCCSYPIVSLQYSSTGDKLLAAAGSAQVSMATVMEKLLLLPVQAIVLDRDGHKIMQCPKGWQYNTDMTHTDVRILLGIY